MAKTQAERQRDYQLRHPDRKRAKQARYAAAERIFRERHRDDYRVLCDPATPHHRRYRLAMIALRAKYPDEWKQVLHDTPAEWQQDHDTLVSVALYAVEKEALPTASDVVHFFEKPWKYDELHQDYLTARLLEESHCNGNSYEIRDGDGDLWTVEEGYHKPDCDKCEKPATVMLTHYGFALCTAHLTEFLQVTTP